VKKIGFIDYYLDEFHANKYPAWIEQASGGSMIVSYAYGMKDKENGLSNADWCRTHKVELLDSIEEVVRLSDYIVVLSPDNPEYHEPLAQLALKSGKPTFIDKTFAPDLPTALRLIELAGKHRTPMYSTSALRFATEYTELNRGDIEIISSWGPGMYANYAIHQIEPIVSLMGSNPKRVMSVGTERFPSILIDYGGGRQATIRHFGGECPFMTVVQYKDGSSKVLKAESDFFALFIRNLVQFFTTEKPAVDAAETIAVMAIIDYGSQAIQQPNRWLELPELK
jgi:hypothetical protein